MASLRVISSSSGKRIEPEWPTSFAEESKNSIIGAKLGIKGDKSQIKYGGGHAKLSRRVPTVRSQPISGNGGHDNYGRGEKVSDPKVNEIGVLRVASSCGGLGCCA